MAPTRRSKTQRRKSHHKKSHNKSEEVHAHKKNRRSTRKMAKGASDWTKKMMEVYRELKKKNPATKLGDAMKEAAARKRKGML